MAVGGGVDARRALRLSLAPFVTGKAVTLTVIVLGAWQHGKGTGRPGWEQLRQAFAYWDGQNYLALATDGYPPDDNPTPGALGHLWGFMPGYPVLVHAVALVLRDAILSGVVVSAACELTALAFIAALVSAERDEASARFATWLVALAPFGVFLTVLYTESAFLAAASASLYFARRGRFGAAAAAAAAGTLIRITGVALVAAVLVEYARQRRWRPRMDAGWLVLVPAPLAAFLAFSHLRCGDALAYFHIQQSASFNRSLASPLSGLQTTYDSARASGSPNADTFIFSGELVCGIAGGVGCAVLWGWRWLGRRLGGHGIPISLAVYATGVWLLGVSQPYWLGLGRYELAMFPLVLPLADAVRDRPQRATGVLVASAGLMIFVSTLWAQGTFVG